MYIINQNGSSLIHYGVKGMKWGVRRTPEQLGHKNIRRARVANIDQWGKTPNMNVLYLTGRSGSGKSTTADAITRPRDSVINLDTYFGDFAVDENVAQKIHDPEFDAYLKARGFNLSSINHNRISKTEEGYKRFYKNVDRFAEEIENYGAEQFVKGNRVVVEGVQIADGLLHPDTRWYKDKPTIVLNTNSLTAVGRAIVRDKKEWLTNVRSFSAAKEYLQWQVDMNAGLSTVANTINAVSGKAYVDELLSKGR